MSICGIDEAGRGCLAGSVYASAVVFHSEPPAGIKDSKQLSSGKRDELYQAIMLTAHVGIGIATVPEIDEINILQATMVAMTRAFQALSIAPDHILVDGNKAPDLNHPSVNTIVRGDATEIVIGAASIIAKVARDREMLRLHELHPQYDWSSNKGYGSPRHLAAIAALGPSAHHRLTFAPMRQPSLAL